MDIIETTSNYKSSSNNINQRYYALKKLISKTNISQLLKGTAPLQKIEKIQTTLVEEQP